MGKSYVRRGEDDTPLNPVYRWCPSCAENGDSFVDLVPRTSKKGKKPGHVFLGCENFTKTGCRYTFPIDQCPLCDGKLRLKTSKTGNSFLGCTNFHSKQCRYTRSARKESPGDSSQSRGYVPVGALIDLGKEEHRIIDWMLENGEDIRWPKGYENITSEADRYDANALGFDDMALYNEHMENREPKW